MKRYSSNLIRAGITFVEVLIVAVVLILLVAMLCPVYEKQNNKSRITDCMANQRHISSAIQLYAQDYSGKLPAATTIWSDIKVDAETLICLSEQKKLTNCYAYNYVVSGKYPWEFRTPAAMMLTCDATPARGALPNVCFSKDDIAWRHHPDSHRKVAVVSFLDGHVQALQTADPIWFKQVKRPVVEYPSRRH